MELESIIFGLLSYLAGCISVSAYHYKKRNEEDKDFTSYDIYKDKEYIGCIDSDHTSLIMEDEQVKQVIFNRDGKTVSVINLDQGYTFIES